MQGLKEEVRKRLADYSVQQRVEMKAYRFYYDDYNISYGKLMSFIKYMNENEPQGRFKGGKNV